MKDDHELLELMMKDMRKVSNFYKPTNQWENHEKLFLPELREKGLHNFRRRKNSILSSFAATDLLPSSNVLRNLKKYRNADTKTKLKLNLIHFFLRGIINNKKTNKFLTYLVDTLSGTGYKDLCLLCYEFAKSYGAQRGAKPLDDFEPSMVGNPEAVFYVNEKPFTISVLSYYIQYAYCCKFINFNSIDTIAEIGSGVGKQVEVIKKLHPKITFYLFDIPPQLYIAQQYLSELFPNSVIAYTKTRNMKQVSEASEGKIFIFEPYMIENLSNLTYDLFWNASSFQEIEPPNVLNYLKYVNQQTKKYVFLQEGIQGKVIAPKKGMPGNLEHTTLDHYKQGLKDFTLSDVSPRVQVPRLTRQVKTKDSFMFWKRK